MLGDAAQARRRDDEIVGCARAHPGPSLEGLTVVAVTSAQIYTWLERYAGIVAEQKQYLTGLDAAIGDGDHGINMDRGFQTVLVKLAPVRDKDVGTLLKTTGMALVGSVGGAGGPLYGTFFLRAGAALDGKAEISDRDLVGALEAGLKGVVERGKANPNDKTMVDALTPAIEQAKQSLDNGALLEKALAAAADAAEKGMKATIPLKALKGRASYLGDRSIGHQGTTGTRFMVFSHDGKVVSTDYLEHEQIYPKPGWVEHNPMEIWEKTQRVIKGSMQKGGIKADEISGIGVTNQRETTVVWEKKTGKPIHNAIVWQDTRTIDICQKLSNDGVEPLVKSKTGLVVATYFSGPKIQWILDNVSGARAAGERGDLLFGNIDTWVIWWLTGGPEGGAHVTDYSNASRTMLMDLKTLDWDAELLSKIKVPRAMLPQIRPSSDKKVYGQTKANGAVGGVVPVCADLGDQQAALFGQTCYSPGEAKNTYGTGNFMLLNTGTSPVPSKSGLLTTAAYGLEQGKSIYALEGSIAITGAAIQWLRDNLGLIKDASETEAIAKSVEDAGGIYFVPAFSGLFAPHWDMYARGAIVGLTRYVTRAHIVRATLEAICYQTKEVADAMEADSGVKLTTLKVDGGAVKNDFLMQLQADILGVKVIRPQVQETTSLGAAYGAGLATGFWSTLDELRKNWQVDKVFEPKSTAEQRAAGLAGWKKAVQRTLGWVEKEPAKEAVGAGAKS